MKKNITGITKNFGVLFLALSFFTSLLPWSVSTTYAASLTSLSDTLSTVKQSIAANHTISFVTPTGISAAQNFTITFAAGFDLSTIVFGDVDITDNGSDLTLGSSASGATWGVAVASQVLTVTSGTGTVTAGHTIVVKIGTNTSTGGVGTHQIVNPSAANNVKISIGGSMTDSGSLAISFISNDVVNVTATVDPTLTFTVPDNTIGFGTLTTANARYATGDTNGGTTASSAAQTLTIATNAVGGYAITYNGATLTDANSHTIPVATITGDADGTPASSQFALAASTDGSGTVASGYEQASNNWKYVASTTTTLISKSTATATETVSLYYIANISATQASGSYSTNITYVATGTF